MTKQIVTMFGDIVASVEADILTSLQAVDPNIAALHYEHGHYTEINATLNGYENSENFFNKKYPLVALFEDIPETVDRFKVHSAILTVIICYSSTVADRSEDRYQKVINPILEPIYESLVEKINRYPGFMGYGFLHRKIIRPYWGVQGKYGNRGNVFSDCLDAIEINDLKINYEQTNCEPSKNNKIWQR